MLLDRSVGEDDDYDDAEGDDNFSYVFGIWEHFRPKYCRFSDTISLFRKYVIYHDFDENTFDLKVRLKNTNVIFFCITSNFRLKIKKFKQLFTILKILKNN